MSYWTQVKTQDEFQAALDARKSRIELAAAIEVSIRVPEGIAPWIKTAAGAVVELLAGAIQLWGNSTATLWENSTATLWGNSTATLWGNSTATLWGNSTATLWENSTATLWENSTATAFATSSLELFGEFVKAIASPLVSVHLHSGAKCKGGVQIEVKQPSTPQEWCEWYGAEIHGGDAILFKAVSDDYCSPKGAVYAPGTETVAEDWDGGKEECGGGLHFSPHPVAALKFNESATKFVACLVPLDSIAVHHEGSYPEKVKAERCWNWYECDRNGKRIGEQFDRPKSKRKVAKKAKAKAAGRRGKAGAK